MAKVHRGIHDNVLVKMLTRIMNIRRGLFACLFLLICQGAFRKKSPNCACASHDESEVCNIVKISSKKIKSTTLAYLRQEGLISKHAVGVCDRCIQVHEREMCKPKKRKLDCKVFIEAIKDGSVCMDDRIALAAALGDSVCVEIYEDCENLKCKYMDFEGESFNCEEYLKERNQVTVSFMNHASGNPSYQNHKKTVYIASSVDSLYKARSINLVTPLPFYKNLISYYICGSSNITRLNASVSSAGTYNCLKNWLNQKCKIECPKAQSLYDTITFFDNNQVISRNWTIKYNHKTKASVVTTVAHISPSFDTTLQQQEHLHPSKWLYGQDHNKVIHLVHQHISTQEETFSNIQGQYMEQRLQKAILAHSMVDGAMVDSISRKIADDVDPVLTTTEQDPYSWVPSLHADRPTDVQVGEPAMVNPCSYESVREVLLHVKNQCEVGTKRHWTIAGCDGLPYNLGQKLLQDDENLQSILLVPGNGHIELNATKCLFKVLWDVALQPLAQLNGFRSPKALMSCKACGNHHKSWTLLMIFFNGTIDEILHQFIIFSNANNTSPSVKELYHFIATSKDPSFRFICDIVLNYVFALFVFRCGIRRNNIHFISSAKCKFLKLFFGTNMTNYQALVFHSIKTEVVAPPEIKHFLHNTESFTITGESSKGEGGDFILEAINARTKRWLPPGAPTKNHWLQVCRNLPKLEDIRQRLFVELQLQDHPPRLYQRDISREIFEWSLALRKSGYLQSREKVRKHVSLTGEDLDFELRAFERKCSTNFDIYMQNVSANCMPGKGMQLEPVFCTVEDRTRYQDIRRKTKGQICRVIEQIMKEVGEKGNESEAMVLEQRWVKRKAGTKNELLEFFKEATCALQDACMTSDTEEEDSDDDNE